jgi:hypothetical protein
MILDVHPESGLFFIPGPNPGVTKVLDPGSATLKFSIPVRTPLTFFAEKRTYSTVQCTKLLISPQERT